jgi:hypothetical protein
MATSIRPDRIMPKDSWLPNVDAPLIRVTVSFPALIRSGSCYSVSTSPTSCLELLCKTHLLTGLGIPSHTQNTVLRLQNNLSAFGQESRGCERHADAEVDVHAILQFLCCALDNALALLRRFSRAWCISLASAPRCQVRRAENTYHPQAALSSAPPDSSRTLSSQSPSAQCS